MTDDNQTTMPPLGSGYFPTEQEIADTLVDCRNNDWESVLRRVKENPRLAMSKLPMENHIVTTVMHQAITAKGDTVQRANLILYILDNYPRAAGVPNGYASYPLHSIAQRNTKMDAKTKEQLIFALLEAYPGALTKTNNQGQRTPLHVLFTDYISPQLTKAMIDKAPAACFIKDKKGYLPAHIACSRHCSPEKLHMLMAVNPQALFEETKDGETLLSLATSTATKSHPNKTLIEALEALLGIDNHDGENPHPRRASTSGLSLIKTCVKIADGSPVCPSIVRSGLPLSHNKRSIRSKRGRRFTFEPIMETTIPTSVSLDLTIDEAGGNGGHNGGCGGGPGSFWQHESFLTDHCPTKKRKANLLDEAHVQHHYDYAHGHDGHGTADDDNDDDDDDDRSDTANLLLHLAARVSPQPPRTMEKAAAATLTAFAQV